MSSSQWEFTVLREFILQNSPRILELSHQRSNEGALQSKSQMEDTSMESPVNMTSPSTHSTTSNITCSPSAPITSVETPSFKQSQIPWSTESQLRWTTCAFIEDLAKLVAIPQAPAITAQYYVQQFYMWHSFATHDRFLVATGCLFLAAKTEEFPIKVRLMVECALYLLLCSEEKLSAKGIASPGQKKNSGKRAKTKHTGATKTEHLKEKKRKNSESHYEQHLTCLHALLDVIDPGEVDATTSKVLLIERIILHTLSFELGVPQPFGLLPNLTHELFTLESLDHSATNEQDIQSLAWVLLSDALKAGLCLAFPGNLLAVGAVYISCLYRHQISRNVTTIENNPWWTIFGYSKEDVEDVAYAYLWMYEGMKMELSPDFQSIWTCFRPGDNEPDLFLVKRLDAALLMQQNCIT